jgi:predicted HNH restriction endonuclease
MGQGGVAFSKLDQLGGQTRRERKASRMAAEEAAERACYRIVDARDGRQCRVCGRGESPRNPITHHHLTYRSLMGKHESSNVLTVCQTCHDAVHVHKRLLLEGDATARDLVTGKLAGVQVSRYTEAGWRTEKWV